MSDVEATAGTRALRSGSTSQGLLLTLLGDYWFGQQVHIPSAALVTLLGEFDISEQAARAALSRVQRTGLLEGVKEGRHTSYRLSERAAEQALVRGRDILAFTAQTEADAPPWDGRWTIVAYSVHSDRSDERRRIRRRLRALGFAPLQDALWVSPLRRAERVEQALDSIGATRVSIFEGADLRDATSLDVEQAWNLDELGRRYEAIIAALSTALDRAISGPRDPKEAFVTRTRAMTSWRPMRWVDPRLPPALLPDDWPGWAARRTFAALYDRLGEPAVERVREIVGAHSEEAAAAVRSDTVSEPR
jgi:phenylacetic acid degradation operon negative regulatory protein